MASTPEFRRLIELRIANFHNYEKAVLSSRTETERYFSLLQYELEKLPHYEQDRDRVIQQYGRKLLVAKSSEQFIADSYIELCETTVANIRKCCRELSTLAKQRSLKPRGKVKANV